MAHDGPDRVRIERAALRHVGTARRSEHRRRLHAECFRKGLQSSRNVTLGTAQRMHVAAVRNERTWLSGIGEEGYRRSRANENQVARPFQYGLRLLTEVG